MQLEREAFEANHFATVVWALGRLQCKPVRLLERIEAQAVARRSMEQMDMQARTHPPHAPPERGRAEGALSGSGVWGGGERGGWR